jgi:hypothetical protein
MRKAFQSRRERGGVTRYIVPIFRANLSNNQGDDISGYHFVRAAEQRGDQLASQL